MRRRDKVGAVLSQPPSCPNTPLVLCCLAAVSTQFVMSIAKSWNGLLVFTDGLKSDFCNACDEDEVSCSRSCDALQERREGEALVRAEIVHCSCLLPCSVRQVTSHRRVCRREASFGTLVTITCYVSGREQGL
jgi:hypothetical protein